ncbi:hypothetical protein ACH5RR_039165 [Cinchona calisaya]|uniref:Uncharacterized protein n=1 Tax=Cinchona calisaya TaxID=153742 RepID=A0ABD2Y2M8_9GENT
MSQIKFGYSTNQGFTLLSWRIEINIYMFLCLMIAGIKAWRLLLYMPCVLELSRLFWELLLRISSTQTKPWLLNSDFNVIESLSKYSGAATQNLNEMADVSLVSSNCGLKTVAYLGSKYTWMGKQNG